MVENNNPDYRKILQRVSQGIPVDAENSISPAETPQLDEEKIATKQEEPQTIVALPEKPFVVASTSTKNIEGGKRKRKMPDDYEERFFTRVDFTHRKPLYITANTHRRLMRIVHLMDSSKATISSYVENMLLHHLETFKDDINNIYQKNNSNPTEE